MSSDIDFFTLAMQVIRDWRVIFITILMIFFVSIANYTVSYRKKRKVPKTKKVKPAPAPKPEKKEGEEDEEAPAAAE